MTKISPFPALRYDTKKVSLAKVVCPPYDVINRQQREGYIKRSPYNIVKIVLPDRKGNRRDYAKAKREFYSWIDKGILKQEDTPAIYIYLQGYRLGKKALARLGFLSLLELEDRSKKAVLPHERVFSKPLLDRTCLIKKTRAHLSPVFIIFQDKNGLASRLLLSKIRDKDPEVDINFEGVRHKMWRVTDGRFIERIAGLMKGAKVFIADGHHRFEASLAVKDYFSAMQKKGAEIGGYSHTLVYLVSARDKGLLILPTHRGVKKLPNGFSMRYMLERLNRYFKVRTITSEKVQDALHRAASGKKCAFVIFYKNKYLHLVLKDKDIIERIGPRNSSYQWKSLDISILHYLVFAKLLGIKEKVGLRRNIYYYKDLKELVGKVKSSEHKLGVFLNPIRMEEVAKIAEADERMPHKSTYFYPKPLTGLVIHKF